MILICRPRERLRGHGSARRKVDFWEDDEKGHLMVIMPQRREVGERDSGVMEEISWVVNELSSMGGC